MTEISKKNLQGELKLSHYQQLELSTDSSLAKEVRT